MNKQLPKYLRPKPTIWQVKKAWVFHHGTYHSVERMPSALFRTIIIEKYPYAVSNLMLKQLAPLDIAERWYILQRYPLKLFYLRKGVFYG